ncbi:MAG TPA: thiamine-phosphate kinase [Terracidiphilus sp.]|nr:thiamine-phosphate kinase [Terracidiphilus sp.]
MALLQRIRRQANRPATGELRLGIGDDCALLRLKPGEEMAVTTDLSIAGRHFHLEWHPPEAIGHRTLARGLSDIAAMGARPVAAFLSLGLPRELTVARGRSPSWADRFLAGFLALADVYQTPLAGGDLAESSLAVADIVLLGAVPQRKALLRSGAQPGDLLYVTGALGGSAAGLALLRECGAPVSRAAVHAPKADNPLAPHLWPQPRIAQGLWLRRNRALTAAIDLSDGLSTDLDHLCAESGVTAVIDAAALPLHPGATLEQALHGGEDYELLFTARPNVVLPRGIAGVAVTQIGTIARRRSGQPSVVLIDESGLRRPLLPGGWQHFF